MLLLRIVAILLGLGIGVSAVLWLLTGERKWFDWSLRLVKAAVATGLVFFGVLAVQRFLE
jgi:hypothetical protein